MEHPWDFVHLPAPSRIAVHPAVAISGPPLAGKTGLAKRLAAETGAVYVSVPEIITQLLSDAALDRDLSFEIRDVLATGGTIPDSAIIDALRHRLASPDVLTHGWIMDDFPLTPKQAEALTAAGIVPHRLLVVHAQEAAIFERAKGAADPVQREAALQRKRFDAYMASAPLLRAYYGLTFSNVLDVSASSEWAIYDQALEATSSAISERLEYYRRSSQGLAARVHGMCFPPSRLMLGESDW